jgi:hypothetical protein
LNRSASASPSLGMTALESCKHSVIPTEAGDVRSQSSGEWRDLLFRRKPVTLTFH